MMNTEQMEFKLGRSQKVRPANRRRNLARASWWFAQMRTAVNESREWSPSGVEDGGSRALSGAEAKH